MLQIALVGTHHQFVEFAQQDILLFSELHKALHCTLVDVSRTILVVILQSLSDFFSIVTQFYSPIRVRFFHLFHFILCFCYHRISVLSSLTIKPDDNLIIFFHLKIVW